MAAKLVPKSVTDPETRQFLQELSKAKPVIAELAIPNSATSSEAIALLEAKLNELVLAWNKQ